MHLRKLEAARQKQGTGNVAHTAVHQIKANPRWTAVHTRGNYSKKYSAGERDSVVGHYYKHEQGAVSCLLLLQANNNDSSTNT